MMVFDGKEYYVIMDEPSEKTVFRLLKITILVNRKDTVDIDLTCSDEGLSDESLCQFSLLIGVNGVGKSTILRGIVDFFIDFKQYYDSFRNIIDRKYKKSKNKHLQIVGVRYLANGNFYDIKKNDEERVYFVNGSIDILPDLPLPHIVASCFGVFDKFPIKNSLSSALKPSRYNSPLYTYVGARASSNIFSTVSSIFQMLYYLLNLKKMETILKVRDVLKYMEYDDRLTFNCRVRGGDMIYSFDSLLESLTYSKPNLRKQWYIDNLRKMSPEDQYDLYQSYKRFESCSSNGKKEYRYNFEFNELNVKSFKKDIRNLYLLRQIGLVTNSDCFLYKKGQKISCNDISSGELNMFCTIVGALSASELENALILIDEPEISQHPNWQMSIIDLLNKGLENCSCHLLMATHSHFLVSDLPRRKSSVNYLKYDSETLYSEKIDEDTYGWSAEEVLLKVFKVPTTRNIYLAKIVGELLDGIAKGNIDYKIVAEKIHFLEEVVKNMNEVDPMKKIINTILDTYK